MRKFVLLASAFALLSMASATDVLAQTCPGNPDALGTSRTLSINPMKQRRIGTVQYPETLPLNDGEIVLTFDDGPIPPNSEKVLDALAAECVKATFFILGENAKDLPDLVRRAYREGHTIGTHTESHPHLAKLSLDAAKEEIEMGIASTSEALGDLGNVAPFVRAPYLETTPALNGYLSSKGLMLWGIDFQTEDWLNYSSDEIVRRAINRIEQNRKGVLLLHDIQFPTAEGLPKLLREIKKRNFKIVHVVPEAPLAASTTDHNHNHDQEVTPAARDAPTSWITCERCSSHLLIGVGLLAGSPSSLPAGSPAMADAPAWLRKAWPMYLSSYITPEGRVIDNGNGGISHSEGQGYAMLISVRARDRKSFDRIWSWTKANLWIRGDDLFAWAWDPELQPHVSDIDDASDGNILIAWALLEAASLWNVDDYRSDAQKIIDAVARHDIVPTRYGPTLLPGSRGFGAADRHDGPIVNLSYWVFPALARFAQVNKSADWRAVIESGLALIEAARFGPQSLPPDWISLAQDRLKPANGFPAVFGYDVVRVPLYLAWARPEDRGRLGIFETALTQPPFVPPAVVELSTGKPGERLGGEGYAAIGTILRCVLNEAHAERTLLDVKKELYYPTTLHILSLLALNDVRPRCL